MMCEVPETSLVICRSESREFYQPDGRWSKQRGGAFVFKGVSDAVQVVLGLREHSCSGSTVVVALANDTEVEIPFAFSAQEVGQLACQV